MDRSAMVDYWVLIRQKQSYKKLICGKLRVSCGIKWELMAWKQFYVHRTASVGYIGM
jgi:hypothetical protein